jgi:hypothetical protein
LGIKMRLCPQVQDATDPATSTKFDRVRIRQASFLANVTKTQNYDIGVLDFADPLLNGNTLRSMIMNIRSIKDPEKKVFISVDKQFCGIGVSFQYTSHYVTEAPAWIKGLLPYVKSLYPVAVHGQLEKCFSPEAVSRSVYGVWDPVKKCVISTADTAINEICDDLDNDDEFEFPDTDTSKFELDISAVKEAEPPAVKTKAAKHGMDPYDADSVSTFKKHRDNAARGVITSNQFAALASSSKNSEVSSASGTIDKSRGTAESF